MIHKEMPRSHYPQPPRIIPTNPEDKPMVDSMLERMKKVQEYDDKIRYLRNTRQNLVEAISKIDVLILDYRKLKKGIE